MKRSENTIEQKIKKATGHVLFSVQEKALMRERLVSYMQHKPIRSHGKTKSIQSSIPLFTFFRAHHYSGALAVALLATVSTFGVSSAADDALPGDLLYPVKVNVNEEIKTVFLGSDAEVLVWESERAELRLQEASQLASEGRLDPERQDAVAKLFAEHTEAVSEKVHAMEESDPALVVEVSTDLEAALGAHEVVLARLIIEQEGEGVEEGGRDLVEQVRTAAKETEKAREGAEQILVADEAALASEDVVSTGEDAPDTVEVSTDEQKSKTESANMRERAVYRAQESATKSLARARGLVMNLEPESDLAQQAMSQISAGEALMAEGTAALAEYDLGTTYGLYRRADMIFEKVARLIEALELFSIEILHDTVSEELPTIPESEDVVQPASGYDVLATDEKANTQALRQGVEDILTETRSLLLTVDGFDEDVVLEANSLIKNAMAHVMRGEIALVLQDEDDAMKLFISARTQAERAFDLVSRAVRDLGVAPVTPPETPTSGDTVPVFSLTHRFEKGTHIWAGTIDMPTPCSILETGALVAESYPEQITLTLNISEPKDAVCNQVVSVRSFEIRAGASKEATVRAVLVNDVANTPNITEEK